MTTETSFPTASRFESNMLTSEQAAKYLGINPGTLAVWRSVKRYEIPYYKVGKSVRYRMEDLNKFLSAGRVDNSALIAKTKGVEEKP